MKLNNQKAIELIENNSERICLDTNDFCFGGDETIALDKTWLVESIKEQEHEIHVMLYKNNEDDKIRIKLMPVKVSAAVEFGGIEMIAKEQGIFTSDGTEIAEALLPDHVLEAIKGNVIEIDENRFMQMCRELETESNYKVLNIVERETMFSEFEHS